MWRDFCFYTCLILSGAIVITDISSPVHSMLREEPISLNSSLVVGMYFIFYFPFLHFIPREIFRYAVTGGANTLLDILLYFITYRYILQMHVVDLGIVAISPHIAAFLFQQLGTGDGDIAVDAGIV